MLRKDASGDRQFFERGLAAVPEDKKEDAFVVGMDKIYKNNSLQH